MVNISQLPPLLLPEISVNYQPSLFSEKQIKKIEEEQKSIKTQQEFTGTKTYEFTGEEKKVEYSPQTPIHWYSYAITGKQPVYEAYSKEGYLIAPKKVEEIQLTIPERLSYGGLALATTATGVNLVTSPAQTILTMGMGGVLSGGVSALAQQISKGKIDIGEVKKDILIGSLTGGALSPLSSLATSTVKSALVGSAYGLEGLFLRDVLQDIYYKPSKPPEINYSPLAYATSAAVGGAIGGGLYKLSSLHSEGKIGMIKPGIVSNEKETWVGLYYEKGAQAKPIFGLKLRDLGGDKVGISLGRNLKFESYTIGDYPKSPIEVFLKKEAMLKYYKDLEAAKQYEGIPTKTVESAYEIMKTAYQKRMNIEPQISVKTIIKNLERLNHLSEKEKEVFANLIIKHLKKDAMLYGTGAQKSYDALSREVRDLDLQFFGKADNLIKEITEKFGDKFVVKIKEGGLGYEIYNLKGEKVLEAFNNYGNIYQIFEKPYFGWGFRTLPPKKTEEGLIMQFREQAARKFASVATPREKGFFPEVHRVKDIGDLVDAIKKIVDKYPELQPYWKAFVSSLNDKNLYNLLKQLDNKVIFEILIKDGSKYVEPSSLYSLLSSLPISQYISMYGSKVESKEVSSSHKTETKEISSSYKREDEKSSDSYYKKESYSIPSLSLSKYSYSIPSPSISSPPSSPPSPSYYQPEQPKRKITLPPLPTTKLIDIKNNENIKKLKTKIISELKYV